MMRAFSIAAAPLILRDYTNSPINRFKQCIITQTMLAAITKITQFMKNTPLVYLYYDLSYNSYLSYNSITPIFHIYAIK